MIVMKTKHQVYIMVFAVVTGDGDVMAPFIFLRGLRLEGLHQITGGNSVEMNRGGGWWKGLHLATEICTMPQKHEKSVLAVRKFLVLNHPNIGPSSFLDCYPIDYYV